MNAIEKYSKELERALENSNAFEAYEDYDEGLRGRFGMPAISRARKPYSDSMPGNPQAGTYVAQYDLAIQYDGIPLPTSFADIALPVLVFNPISLQNVLQGVEMPAGVTVVSTDIDGASNSVYIEYQAGGTTVERAKIKIKGKTANIAGVYYGLLGGDEFKINKIRLQTTDTSYIHMFTTSMYTFGRTTFGKTFLNDAIPLQSQKSPMQYDRTILDIDTKLQIQKDSGFIYTMPPFNRIAGSVLNVSLFIEQLKR